LHMSIDDNTNPLFIFLYEFLCMLSGANHPRLKVLEHLLCPLE
jgi:hypothetical protein